MISLSVNINKIALLRNARMGDSPSLSEHAMVCLKAGAAGITVHPRPDQRHIRVSDLLELSALLASFSNAEFNIEGNPFAKPRASANPNCSDYPGFLAIAKQIKPDQCTLVPDAENQLTSDHGFDLKRDGARLTEQIAALKTLGCRVSVFIDADDEQVQLAATCGADRVELFTGPYAEHRARGEKLEKALEPYLRAAETALASGLEINAGHDLSLNNLAGITALPGLREVSIGHALIGDALSLGLQQAVEAYLKLLSE